MSKFIVLRVALALLAARADNLQPGRIGTLADRGQHSEAA